MLAGEGGGVEKVVKSPSSAWRGGGISFSTVQNVLFVQSCTPVSKIALCETLGYIFYQETFQIIYDT